jgi:hypothetical protein
MPNGNKNTFGYNTKRLSQSSSSSSPTVGSLLYRRAALNMTFGSYNKPREFFSYPFIIGKIYKNNNN